MRDTPLQPGQDVLATAEVSADGGVSMPIPTARSPAGRATVRFMCAHGAHMIALGFGAGLSRRAPGTVGTLWAWLSFAVMSAYLTPVHIAGVIGVSLLVGWWACTVTAAHMCVLDPGQIVWDEVVAFWMVLFLVTPASWMVQLAAFALFRFFDALKPGPVAWADQQFKGFGWRGGFGILFDDLVAAACTLLVIAVWRY